MGWWEWGAGNVMKKKKNTRGEITGMWSMGASKFTQPDIEAGNWVIFQKSYLTKGRGEKKRNGIEKRK